MAKTYETQSKGIPWFVKLVAGAAIAAAGVYFNQNHTFESIDHAAQGFGIPLEFAKTVTSLGVLVALFPVVEIFFITPLADAIRERNNHLENTFAEAESLRADIERTKNEYEKRIAATEADAREQIQRGVREAQDLAQKLKAEATADYDRKKATAEAEIEAAKQQAIVSIQTEVVDIALAAATKVVGENMDDDRNRRLVERFVNDAQPV